MKTFHPFFTTPTPTTRDRERGAALLRSAAQVMDAAGYAPKTYISDSSGSVCMEGAIRAAVWGIENTDASFHFGRTSPTIGLEYAIAIDALIDLLPDRCTAHANMIDCSFCDSDMVLDTNNSRIHHYNDFVCTGGEEASALLLQAAEKIEADLP